MSTATTLASYGAALALVFGTAVGVGNAVGPVGATAEPAHSTDAPLDPTHDAEPDAGSDGIGGL